MIGMKMMVPTSYLLLLTLAVITYQETLAQSTGDLRLYPSSSSSSSSSTAGGRLEMYYSGWYPFTITGFDLHDADVACKTLGYSYATRYARVSTLGYSRSYTSYSIYRVNCPTSATSFRSCSYRRFYSGSSSSRHYYDVGLKCTRSKSTLRLVSSSGYTSGISSGRLEIFVNNTWGTVCDDNFGSTEASVACKQLRFSSYSGYTIADSTVGYATSLSIPIWLDNLSCTSLTSDLRKCTNVVGIHDCSHSEDVILTCNSGHVTTASTPFHYTTSIPARSGELRLVSDGSTSTSLSSGRLEIYYYNYGYKWIPFCYDSFSSHEANVACKTLGFSAASSYGLVGSMGFAEGSGSFSISSYCDTYAKRFSSCSLRTITYCSHDRDVALRCSNEISVTASKPSRGSIRLVSSNGYSDTYLSKGRLEVFAYQSSGYNWTTFCSSSFSSHFADLACRQLGYNRASDFGKVGAFGYDQGSGSRSITYVTCPSYATTLDSCSFSLSSSCSHKFDVAISCTYDPLAVSSGLIIGLTIGSLFLCSLMILSGCMCAAVIGIVYRKKNVPSPRTNIVESQLQNPVTTGKFRMSELASKENEYETVSAFQPVSVGQKAPSTANPVTLQQAHVQMQNDNFNPQNEVGAAAEIDIEDDANDLYASDDEKPLINS